MTSVKGNPQKGVAFTIRRADAKRALKKIKVNRGREGADDNVHVLVSEFAVTFRAMGTESEYPVNGTGPGTAQLPISIFAIAIDMRSTSEIQLKIASGEIYCGKAVIRHSAITVGTIPDMNLSIPINASPFDLLVIDRVIGTKAAADQGLAARLQAAREGLKTALSKASSELADYGVRSADLELMIETAMSKAEPRVREALSS